MREASFRVSPSAARDSTAITRGGDGPNDTIVLNKEIRAPMSLSESMLGKCVVRDEKGVMEPAFAPVFKNIESARGLAESVAAAANKVNQDGMATSLQKSIKVTKLVEAMSVKIVEKIDDSASKLQALLAKSREFTERPMVRGSAMEIANLTQTRDVLRAMTPADRSKVIREAIEAGDNTMLAAVFEGSPLLCGLSKAERDAYQLAWRKKSYPVEVANEERYERALRVVEQCGTATVAWLRSLMLDSDAARVARESEAAINAAMHAAGLKG